MSSNPAALTSFDEFVRDLGELNRLTEAEFLAVGGRLQSISHQARDLADESGSVAALMSGDQLSRGIEKLRQLLDQASGFEKTAGSSRESLQQMRAKVHQCGRMLVSFERLVLILKVLAVQTRIESARAGSCDIDFSSLGDDVARLAAEIETNSANILAGSTEIDGLLRESLGRLTELGTQQKSELSALIRDASAGLDSLTAIHSRALEAAGAVSERYGAICSKTGELVRSLQFQDITRQQIDHVREALEAVSPVLASAVKTHRRRASPEMADAVDTVALQVAQLRNSKETLTTAVERIMASLRTMAQEVAGITQAPGMVAGAAEQDGAANLEAIRERLSKVGSDLTRFSASSAEIRSVVSQVVPGVERMSGAAGQIESIGFRLRLVALNAQVKTAQIGAAGAALGVLAGRIQELTADTSASTGAIAGHLRSLSGQVQELKREDRSQPAGDDRGALDFLAEGISREIESVTEIDRTVSGKLAGIAAAGASLRADLTGAAGALEANTQASHVCGDVAGVLEGFVESWKGKVAGVPRLGGPEKLARERERYTMDSEREVHGTFQAAGPKQSVATPTKATDDELGENVELF